MAKKESTFVNMVFVLFLVSFVSSAALGVVYELTKEPIRLVDITKKNDAIQSVVPGFTNIPANESFKVASDSDSLTFYPARKDSILIGTAVETYTMKGFSGLIRLMVGFAPDGTILTIAVLEHKETPGLGDKIDKSKSGFSLQFEGKNPANFKLSVKKDKGDVDAITASTISSRAYCDAVRRAYDAYIKESKKELNR
jgi:Na+-translocating ferredoxin:NAD+ oxidoreductase subunit G